MPSDTEDAVSKASALATGKMADLRLDTTQNQVGHFNYLFLYLHLLLMCTNISSLNFGVACSY